VPVEQQVVVVQRLVGELALHVGTEQARELVLPFRAPRKRRRERLGQRTLRIDPVRIDRKTGVLARKTLLGAGEVQLVAQQIHQVGGVAAIHHREVRIQPHARGMPADQTVRDRMERARPRQLDLGRGLAAAGPRIGGRPLSRTVATMRCARRVISCAARRVKVSSRIRSGLTPSSTRCATRCASVLVLPVPAPAMISSGRHGKRRGLARAEARRRTLGSVEAFEGGDDRHGRHYERWLDGYPVLKWVVLAASRRHPRLPRGRGEGVKFLSSVARGGEGGVAPPTPDSPRRLG